MDKLLLIVLLSGLVISSCSKGSTAGTGAVSLLSHGSSVVVQNANQQDTATTSGALSQLGGGGKAHNIEDDKRLNALIANLNATAKDHHVQFKALSK